MLKEATEANSIASPSGLGDDTNSGARPLVWIVVSGVLVRVLLLVWFHGLGLSIGDEHDYDRIAKNLVRSGEFAFSLGQRTSLRPPLYPAFVAAFYALFGEECFDAWRMLSSSIGWGPYSTLRAWDFGRRASTVFTLRSLASTI
jgi:4-amino-4-deoxy-L-arabinose transferase-like glycosyltransferase